MKLTTNNKLAILSVSVVGVIFLLFFQPFSGNSNQPQAGNPSDVSSEIINMIEDRSTSSVTVEGIKELEKETRKKIEAQTEEEPEVEAEEEVNNEEPEDSEESKEEVSTTTPEYIEVVDGCGPYYQDDCLNVRSAPSTDAEVVNRLRTGIVLKVAERVEADGRIWYKTVFDEWLRHPERVEGDWYVAADFVEPVDEKYLEKPEPAEGDEEKRIVVDLSEQKLYAYEGEQQFMQTDVSTGIVGSITPRGSFTVFHRTPSRYMQGPIPGITDDDYDLPGVPWNLYFTQQGAVIHGAYWHDNFGMNWSHGCVNVRPEVAKELFRWAPEGTEVLVQD